jgi:hypothetical protein
MRLNQLAKRATQSLAHGVSGGTNSYMRTQQEQRGIVPRSELEGFRLEQNRRQGEVSKSQARNGSIREQDRVESTTNAQQNDLLSDSPP